MIENNASWDIAILENLIDLNIEFGKNSIIKFDAYVSNKGYNEMNELKCVR